MLISLTQYLKEESNHHYINTMSINYIIEYKHILYIIENFINIII